jgi:DNA-binding IclR family transcriptional regulator
VSGNIRYEGNTVVSKISSILLTFSHGDRHSLTEVARLAHLPLSTTWRLMTELAKVGILERSTDGQYRAGWQLRLVGGSASEGVDLYDRAPRVLEDLAAATQTTVRLGIFDGHEVRCLDKGEIPPYWSPTSRLSAVPAHATAMGKVLLAFAAADIVDHVIAQGLQPYTPFTLTSPRALRQALAVTRLTGVAISRREFDLDMLTVAVPTFGPGGTVVAALELEVGKRIIDLRSMQPVLVMAARTLSRELTTSGPTRRLAPLSLDPPMVLDLIGVAGREDAL